MVGLKKNRTRNLGIHLLVFFLQDFMFPSLKLTFSPLKMDGWNTTFLLGRHIFRGYVSFREGIRDHF